MRPDDFRWQALFQRTREPLFVLSRQRRILFVNRAWEELTGMSAAEARGQRVGHRRKPATLALGEALAHALAPPPEVLQGQPGRACRLVPGPAGRRWWDVEFFPLRGGDGLLGVLGKVLVLPADVLGPAEPLPEELIALREALAGRYGLDLFNSDSPAVRLVAEQMRLCGQTRVSVSIVGEPGAGKQTAARVLHYQGVTRAQTFAALDCGGLPPAAMEGTLFASHGLALRPGVGTIYLKEPGRLPRDLQGRLADLLTESSEPGTLRPRWVAGFLGEPADEVRAGRLLEELGCALGTVVITLPPLRDRRADLYPLVERLLRRAASDGAARPTGLTPEARAAVERYPWPGNLRELFAVLRVACLRSAGPVIDVVHLPAYVRQTVHLKAIAGAAPERSLPLDQLLEQAERRLIALALRLARGNRSRAAAILAIWRPRLQRRMEALGLDDE